jgi:chitin disaccharide deacetylase
MTETAMHQTQVIVNGDDFGRSQEVNEGIIQAFRAGALTSCSLMVSGEAFDQAVRLAQENDSLAVGIHLVTVQGKAVLPHTEIPHLTDRQGNFSDNPVTAGLKYYFSRSAREQLKKELAAQFHRFLSTGLKLSHVDSHLHMHVHPVIFAIALELAELHQVRRMRIPCDDFPLAVRFQRYHSGERALAFFIFWLLTRRMHKRLRERNFVFAERVYGYLFSGRMTLEYVLYVLDHLSAATNEIYFHPSSEKRPFGSPLNRSEGLKELEILTGSSFRNRLHGPDILLTNYFGMTAAR